MSLRHHAITNEIGQRLAEFLECEPSAFWACADGLAVSAYAIREHVLRDDIPSALGSAAMSQCGWCIRATRQAWTFDPEAFGLDWQDDCLPAGIHDCRALPLAAVLALIAVERVAA